MSVTEEDQELLIRNEGKCLPMCDKSPEGEVDRIWQNFEVVV